MGPAFSLRPSNSIVCSGWSRNKVPLRDITCAGFFELLLAPESSGQTTAEEDSAPTQPEQKTG